MSNQRLTGQAIPFEDRDADHKEAKKVRQVVQHFFTKAALAVVSSRVSLPLSFHQSPHRVKSDRWFNLIIDDSDVIGGEVAPWADLDVNEYRPPPLFVEIYLDTGELTRNQTLVISDERGRKWDALEAFESTANARTGNRSWHKKNPRIVLERWKIHLGQPEDFPRRALTDLMPNVYKKGVVLFRSLYTHLRLLPAWSFGRRLAEQPATLTSLRPMHRIFGSEPDVDVLDMLELPLYPSAEATTRSHKHVPVYSPVGPLSIDVTYRVNCDFRVDDSEALLSSHFLGLDNQYLRGKEAGSLPAGRPGFGRLAGPTPAYGSMSTFHQPGAPTGTSPMSALRAARDMNAESPIESPPSKVPSDHRPSPSSKSSLKTAEGGPYVQRRVSVSFQPFKAGSLSSSPVPAVSSPLSPRPSSCDVSNTSSGQGHTRNRSSQTSMPATARSGQVSQLPGNEVAVASPISVSPKAPPITRYSSSFGHRRSRLSSGGGGSSSKNDEDNNSSGKASQASSNQPGSGLMAEGEGGSSGSVHTEEDNISDFISLLEQKKDLKSFNRSDGASRGASARRTTAALSKFQKLRDSHAALTDSLSSSLMVQQIPSPGTSSRNASSNPPMLAGASVSTSSSPGKPVSPHTPHTPAVPSRLGANATINQDRVRTDRRALTGRSEDRARPRDAPHDTMPRTQGSTAIDIPTSPQRHGRVRRSSSSARHPHNAIEAEFGMRSASVPIDGPPDLSLSELFTMHEPLRHSQGDSAHNSRAERVEETQRPSPLATTPEPLPPFRSRVSRGGARGSTSSIGTGSGSGGRYSFSARPAQGGADDDEPLLFTMSELGANSRRSHEDFPGTRGASRERGGAESGSNSRRASRRGF